MVVTIANVAAAVFGFLALLYLVYLAARGDKTRDDEMAARAFFDAHGHWPDEDPAEL